MDDNFFQHLSGWGWLCVLALGIVGAILGAMVIQLLPDRVILLLLVAYGLFALLKHLGNPRKP